jgi:MarR family transcriptional regulator, organic hydroperoxide resistance regulator
MATVQSGQRAADRVSTGKTRQRTAPPVMREEIFPPLSISLESFVQDGSDREFRRLIYSLFSLSMLMERNREHFAAYIGVTSPQAMMMGIIAEGSNVTVSSVADRLTVSSQFVTMEMNKLIAKAIVEKRPNDADRRSMFLTLTQKGRALINELGPIRQRINDMTFRSLTRERAKTLQEILDVLVMDAGSAVHEFEAPQMRGRMAPTAMASVDERNGDNDRHRMARSKRQVGA